MNKGCACVECLDYTNPKACLSVLNIRFIHTHCSQNSVSLAWDLVSAAEGYKVFYKKQDSIVWNENPMLTNLNHSDTVGGLDSNTWYEFKVITYCENNKSCSSLTHYYKTKI